MNDDLISRDAVLDACSQSINILDAMSRIEDLPSVTPKQRTGRCVWCSSPFRIEYYWIDCDGNTASFADEDKHIVATGIAKFCPNCGAKMVEPQESEVSDGD